MTFRTRRPGREVLLAVCAGVALAGCHDPVSPSRDLTGTWAAAASFPGSSFVFTLSQLGDSLQGTGTYAGEAGPSGTLTVFGHLQAAPSDSVTLVFTLMQQLPTVLPAGTETFAGRLSNATTLTGSVRRVSGATIDTVTATYLRSH